MALYFDAMEDLHWKSVPAERVLSAEFSSIGGLHKNVRTSLASQGIITGKPRNSGASGGSGCAV
jgi:hypothetical protein